MYHPFPPCGVPARVQEPTEKRARLIIIRLENSFVMFQTCPRRAECKTFRKQWLLAGEGLWTTNCFGTILYFSDGIQTPVFVDKLNTVIWLLQNTVMVQGKSRKEGDIVLWVTRRHALIHAGMLEKKHKGDLNQDLIFHKQGSLKASIQSKLDIDYINKGCKVLYCTPLTRSHVTRSAMRATFVANRDLRQVFMEARAEMEQARKVGMIVCWC